MKIICSLFFIFIFLQGCASRPLQQFEKIKQGMEKGTVLDLIGSPQFTKRSLGLDRWTYIFYQDDIKITKEVHFDQGTVTYVGDVQQPIISADEQDQINKELQKKLHNHSK